MQFQPGQSGNPSGKPAQRPFLNALRMALTDPNGKPDDNMPKLRLIAAKLIEKAASGDPQAIKEIADRLDGKPAQSVIHGGDGSEINVKTTVAQVIVDPKDAG
jgi:hypothetical protein